MWHLADKMCVGHPERLPLSPRQIAEAMAYETYNTIADDRADLRAGRVAMYAARAAGHREAGIYEMMPQVRKRPMTAAQQAAAQRRAMRQAKAAMRAFHAASQTPEKTAGQAAGQTVDRKGGGHA